jgi:alginate O-acetyltransferase complex protein AlgI
MANNFIYTPFLIFSTLLDWFLANLILKSENLKMRKGLVVLSLIANLGILLFFKTSSIIISFITPYILKYNIPIDIPEGGILIPLGISFYTFQTISYTIDIYRGDVEKPRSFKDYALFVSFFPQLVAGPIIRSNDFLPQCDYKKKWNSQAFYWGIFLIILGLFQKVVLADVLFDSIVTKVFYSPPVGLFFLDAWAGAAAFTGQIYYDFSGYSTCAIGIALTLGYKIKDNFRTPLGAEGFSDFWRRWHVSLYTWFRDYLYYPLGGSRKGLAITCINVSIVTVLSGLWHNFSLTYLIWGVSLALGLIAELLIRHFLAKKNIQINVSKYFLKIITLGYVIATIVFFRADSVENGSTIIKAMFGLNKPTVPVLSMTNLLVFSITFSLFIGSQWWLYDKKISKVIDRLHPVLLVLFICMMISLIFIAQGTPNEFIYFQF